MKMSITQSQLKKKLITLKQKHNSLPSTENSFHRIPTEKLKIRGKNKILSDIPTNYTSKINSTDITISNYYTDNNSSTNTIVQSKQIKNANMEREQILPDIDIKHFSVAHNKSKCKTPVRLRTLAKNQSFITEHMCHKKIPFTGVGSSSQSSPRDNVLLLSLKKQVKSLSRELEVKNEFIKEINAQNEINKKLGELFQENQLLKKEIVHLKELIITNKKSDFDVNNNFINSNEILIEQLKNNFNDLHNKYITTENDKNNFLKEIDSLKVQVEEINQHLKIKNEENEKLLHENSMMSSIINKLIEKENKNVTFENLLSDSEVEGIEFMLTQMFISNQITYDSIFEIIITNLTNFEKLVTDLLSLLHLDKIESSLLKNENIIIMKFLVTISNNKGNFSYRALIEYFNKLFEKIELIKENNHENEFNDLKKMNMIIKGCKFYDKTDSGIITIDKFYNVFYNIFTEHPHEESLFRFFVQVMKNNNEKMYKLGLYELNYNLLINKISSYYYTPEDLKVETSNFINDIFNYTMAIKYNIEQC